LRLSRLFKAKANLGIGALSFCELLRSVKNIRGMCRFTPYRKLYLHLAYL
jgi:hypothetical protein